MFRLISLLPKKSRIAQWKQARMMLLKEKIQVPAQIDLLIICPSLGEYETIKSLLEQIKDRNKSIFIEIAFFSPSGYHPLKDTIKHKADRISYMPADTKKEVKKFFAQREVKQVMISALAIWPCFLNQLIDQQILYYFVAVKIKIGFAKRAYYRSMSTFLEHAKWHFCIDELTLKYLTENINLENAVLTGDPRLDSIKNELEVETEGLSKISAFKKSKPIIVFGSTHSKDDQLIIPIIQDIISMGWLCIIAPHDPSHARSIKEQVDDAHLLSEIESDDKGDIIILDQIGILKYCYQLSDLTYIGGGFDMSLHNVLEPMIAGNIVITGPQLQKSIDAQLLHERGALPIIHSQGDLIKYIKLYREKKNRYEILQEINQYLEGKYGATERILEYL